MTYRDTVHCMLQHGSLTLTAVHTSTRPPAAHPASLLATNCLRALTVHPLSITNSRDSEVDAASFTVTTLPSRGRQAGLDPSWGWQQGCIGPRLPPECGL